MFGPDAQKARVDDAVGEYGHLTLAGVVHKGPRHFFGVQDQLGFQTKKHFGAWVLLSPLSRGVTFLPTVSIALSVLQQGLSGVHSRANTAALQETWRECSRMLRSAGTGSGEHQGTVLVRK